MWIRLSFPVSLFDDIWGSQMQFIQARVGYLSQTKDTITSTINFWSFGHIRTKNDFSSRTLSAYPREFFRKTKAKTWTIPDLFLLLSHSNGIRPSLRDISYYLSQKEGTSTPISGLHKEQIYSLLQKMPSPQDLSLHYLLQKERTPNRHIWLTQTSHFLFVTANVSIPIVTIIQSFGQPFSVI